MRKISFAGCFLSCSLRPLLNVSVIYPENTLYSSRVRAIGEMRDAVALWQAVEGEKNTEHLISAKSQLSTWSRISVSLQGPALKNESRAELLENCKHRLRIFVNDRLSQQATRAQLALTKNGDFQITFRPKNLLGAMWLQFAQAMAHNYEIKICRGCGRPFQTGAGTTRRADATTCKDSCRQTAYRKEHAPKRVQSLRRRAK